MSTFYAGAGAKLSVGLQSDYFDNRGTTAANTCDVDTRLNITSTTFDPTVEKGSEETLMQSQIKNGSYLLSIGMDGSFDANLRPSMTPWLFKAALQNATPITDTSSEIYTEATSFVAAKNGYNRTIYVLGDAGVDPLGSTFVLTKGDQVTTYPAMTIRSMNLNAPNNDFVTVSCDMVGREEIKGTGTSKIPAGASPATSYVCKTDASEIEDEQSYIVTHGVFKWGADAAHLAEWCIEDSSISLDNGIEDSPRCYQDGQYANIPVMGMRAITMDFNMPYDDRVEDLKEDYLLTSAYGSAVLEFCTPEATPESYINVIIPRLSITSVGAGISGTGVIESSVSGEAVKDPELEAIYFVVDTKN